MPNKIQGYLKRAIPQLEFEFDLAGKFDADRFFQGLKYFVREEVDWSDWNGGTSIHELVIFVEEGNQCIKNDETTGMIQKLLLKKINEYSKNLSQEALNSVTIDIADERDLEYINANGISDSPFLQPEDWGIWKENCLRVFLSHRATSRLAI